ncbi:Clp protease ClpP [Pasteurella atlantica]|uniref:Clp protease ClpP n=3 Tax=Pasteurellales TaxID=135625 RepID=A0ACC6HJV7_9PAST|nr:ClpP-like prohead protease/major capsid protein fusion protein [Pasteurella atlantica]MDP8051047.1 Clp protease ClpP [Pasteurella atlantica]MDP8104343.1 Clp protease ClpP [Pasteurella atlantica]MDP8147703.1 Clp protease ClpP [Pasteurella atlantica]
MGQKKSKKILMKPKAMTTKTNNQNWFSIKAKSKGTAEISIYDEIGMWGVSAKQFSKELMDYGDLKHINLHIHSPGGDAFDGIAIYNLLKNHSAQKTVYIDGLAASMASVIAMAGDKIVMPENAMMMIHKPWGVQGGDAEDMRKYAELLDKVEGSLTSAYINKTGIDENELAEMLSNETWLNGKECLELGFADELAEPVLAMASIQSRKLEDYENMPKAIKNLLEPKAQAKAPKEEKAPENKVIIEPQNKVVEKEVDNAAAVQAELTARNEAIKSVFKPFAGQFDDVLIECLSDLSCTKDKAQEKLLAKLGEKTTPSVTNSVIYVGNGNIVGDSIKASLLSATGNGERQNDNIYNGMTLRELARASLVDRGVGVAGLNPLQMVGLAFTHSTSDFGHILIDVAHKSVMKGWEEANENFAEWTTKGTLSDFRPAHRVGLGGFESLPQVREGAEYTYVTLGDTGTLVSLATYGALFSITRQTIINDDMNMLTSIPFKLGRAARATIADLIFAQLTGDPVMAYDGKKLYDASHKNTLTNGAIDVTNIDNAIQMMNAHKSFDGKQQLAIEPDVMLTPTTLFTRAKQVVGSASVEGADINSGIINPIQNILPITKSQRLQAHNAKQWYLLNKEAIEVSYLNGVETPFIDQQTGFTIDGVTTKVRIDAGVNVLDHRGIIRVTNK